MNPETDLFDLGLSRTKESPLPIENSLPRARIEMDGVAAAWLLFQFSRQSREQKATHTIRTLLPNGALKVVNIEVECMMTKKDSAGKQSPVGLPGAFAQDIFIALMDHLVNQVRSTHGELIAKARTTGLKGISLPPSCTEVYFRNKDLALTMRLQEKNARITTALQHLHKTHIKIRGCIYREGKEETVEHDTYYIPSLSAGKRLRGGMDRVEWQRAKFDEVLVKEILHGYIAQMDREKLLNVKSGAPRKLYALLAAKSLDCRGAERIVITCEEITKTLQIQPSVFKKFAKRYFEEMKNANIILNYAFEDHKGVSVVVFVLPPEEQKKLPITPSAQVEQFFFWVSEVAKRETKLAEIVSDRKACDLDVSSLRSLLNPRDGEIEFEARRYPKALLWADMLLHNRCQGQGIKSIVALLKSLLKKNEAPTLLAGFIPMQTRFERWMAKSEAQAHVDREQELTRDEDAKVREMAERAWQNYNPSQKERLLQAVKIDTKGQALLWEPTPEFLEFRAVALLVSAINHGLPTSDVSGILRWYAEERDSIALEELLIPN
jgi:hypothetical protein